MTTRIFGQQASFAIEAEFTGAEDKWRFGHLRFWIGGSPIGDFDETSDLAGSARWGRQFLSASARRSRGDLDDSPGDAVYYQLYGRFFERGGSAPGESFDRDPFVLDEVGESSLRDKVTILVVRRGGGRDRVLLRDYQRDGFEEHDIPRGICDEAIDSYCTWVEGL
jgi:hypothetical protein